MANTPEYMKTYNKAYRLKNPESAKLYKRKAYHANPEHYRKQRREWSLKNPTRQVQSYLKMSAKQRARDKNLPFDLTLDDIIIPEYCPILPWIKIQKNTTGKGPCDTSPTLDRIIPELGYVKGNIQVISSRANVLKSNATPKELQALASWINTQFPN